MKTTVEGSNGHTTFPTLTYDQALNLQIEKLSLFLYAYTLVGIPMILLQIFNTSTVASTFYKK